MSEFGPGRPVGYEQQQLWLRAASILIPVALVVLALVTYRLVQQGTEEFLDSTGGRVQETVTDPFSPGYEAIVETTPSILLLMVGEESEGEPAALASAALVTTDPTEAGGSVLVFPSVTQADTATLADAFDDGQVDAVRSEVQALIGAKVDEVAVLDGPTWLELLDQTGPIELDIPDRLVSRDAVGTASLVFEAGPGQVSAEFAALYVGWRNPNENAFVYLGRQFGFWEAFLDNIAAAPEALPASAEPGATLAILVGGDYEVREVDYELVGDVDGEVRADLDLDELDRVVAELLPFPNAVTPGERARVRLLDGVGDRDALLDYSKSLVLAGAQVTVIGNASEFDREVTRVVVHDRGAEADAERFVDILGAGQIETDIPDTSGVDQADIPETIFDVTVVIGSDVNG